MILSVISPVHKKRSPANQLAKQATAAAVGAGDLASHLKTLRWLMLLRMCGIMKASVYGLQKVQGVVVDRCRAVVFLRVLI